MNHSEKIDFQAPEYQADGSVESTHYSIEGSCEQGWRLARNGQFHLSLGEGYVLLRAKSCGVCSTDLARRFLPFPLPQITGHEVLALDHAGRRVVAEINASHQTLGQKTDCPFCSNGLPTHCPQRKVLGIHDLPGGFGPFLLAPQKGIFEVPEEIDDETAVLIEPFAAALHAARMIGPRIGESVAVLGTGRLGLLAIAALAAERRRLGFQFRLIGFSRRENLQRVAKNLGADEVGPPPKSESSLPVADIVVDTTGAPEGLALALALARKEVHLKSTHGRSAAGLQHPTEAVVDEITLSDFSSTTQHHLDSLAFAQNSRPLVLWQSTSPPPQWLLNSSECLEIKEPDSARTALSQKRRNLPAADLVVVDHANGIDQALRPWPGQEESLVRARGEISISRASDADGPLVIALSQRNLRLSTSRCGDFKEALALLGTDAELVTCLPQLITHRLRADQLGEALETAQRPESIKVIVEHRHED